MQQVKLSDKNADFWLPHLEIIVQWVWYGAQTSTSLINTIQMCMHMCTHTPSAVPPPLSVTQMAGRPPPHYPLCPFPSQLHRWLADPPTTTLYDPSHLSYTGGWQNPPLPPMTPPLQVTQAAGRPCLDKTVVKAARAKFHLFEITA